MRPKLLRIRLLPVNDLLIAFMPVLLPRARNMRRSKRPSAAARLSSRWPPRVVGCGVPNAVSGGNQPISARPYVQARPVRTAENSLLDLDRCALIFQHLLDLAGLVLVDAFLDGLRRALDEILGFLQPETRDRADLLDHVDLLVTRLGEDDGELRLLLGGRGRCCGSARGRRRRNRGDGRRGTHAPALL